MNSLHSEKLAHLIKKQAKSLGFSFCGISKATVLEEEAPRLEKWLNNNMHGEMQYMANHFDKRLDPRLLVDDSKSIISVLYNYYTDKKQSDAQAPKISKYAYGEDYHVVVKDKLHDLFDFIKEQVGEVNGRVFVDSAPVMDKVWAKKSGLGWMGKNSNLINKQQGSFFFIGEIILDLELPEDGPIKDYCGTCTRCIDACPTNAIVEPYVVDGSKCISYFTIELKKEIPNEVKGKFENWVFGCDICQDVCPWNNFSKPHNEPRFEPALSLMEMTKKDFENLTEETFNRVFKKSAVKRTKFNGLKRNIQFLKPAF
ncbi:MAG: tRNA epoxyqueuosine(34) reductase QueG [Bacteroidia bacterium]